MSLSKEELFFHDIAKRVLDFTNIHEKSVVIARHKSIIGDVATTVDLGVEKLIVDEISKHFQGDHIMAEENYADTVLTDDRIWIIDPICGTANLSRGIKWFCTNIALADNKQIIASCVIDHSQGLYYWSTGSSELHIADQPFLLPESTDREKIIIDVDLAALYRVSDDKKRKHCEAVYSLSLEPGYQISSPSSSLGFMYTAIQKIDGFINVINYPWDIAAGSFLLQQAGGIITDLNGEPWDLKSVGAIGATNAAVHQKLVEAYAKD